MVRDHNSGERRSAQRVTRAEAIYSSVRNGLKARYLTPMKSIAAGHFISGKPQRRSANARSQRPFNSGEQVCRLPRPQAISSRAGLGLNSSQAADSTLRLAPIGISTTVEPRAPRHTPSIERERGRIEYRAIDIFFPLSREHQGQDRAHRQASDDDRVAAAA